MDAAVCEEGGHTWRATQGRKSTIKTDDSFTDPPLRYRCIHTEGGGGKGATFALRSSENINTLPRLGRLYVGLYSNCCACYVLLFIRKGPGYSVASIILPAQRRRMDSVRVSDGGSRGRPTGRQQKTYRFLMMSGLK